MAFTGVGIKSSKDGLAVLRTCQKNVLLVRLRANCSLQRPRILLDKSTPSVVCRNNTEETAYGMMQIMTAEGQQVFKSREYRIPMPIVIIPRCVSSMGTWQARLLFVSRMSNINQDAK